MAAVVEVVVPAGDEDRRLQNDPGSTVSERGQDVRHPAVVDALEGLGSGYAAGTVPVPGERDGC
ncbi:hypothetical protein [Streptomyces sp. NPDC004376]